MALTYSQSEIDAFKDAMLKNPGVLEMWIADRKYKFSTLQEMRDHLKDMELNIETRASSTITRFAATSKGF